MWDSADFLDFVLVVALITIIIIFGINESLETEDGTSPYLLVDVAHVDNTDTDLIKVGEVPGRDIAVFLDLTKVVYPEIGETIVFANGVQGTVKSIGELEFSVEVTNTTDVSGGWSGMRALSEQDEVVGIVSALSSEMLVICIPVN